jgi:hypothetical protein
MVPGMGAPRSPAASEARVSPRSFATLAAAAEVVERTGSVVHVVLPREPGVVGHAREMGRAMGFDVFVDLRPVTLRVRLGPPSRV